MIKIPALAFILGAIGASAGESSFDQFWQDMRTPDYAAKSPVSQRRLDWWREARYGMFIHWNMSSVAAAEISWGKMFNEGLGEELTPNPRPSAGPAAGRMGKEVDGWRHEWMRPPVPGNIYDDLYKSFFPGMFDADHFVTQAKQAGMKYIVQIAKHHDGFCMWDSKFTDYDIMATPFKRDIISEMAKACEKAGMKFGIYYSQRDWHHPDYGPERMAKYNQYMRDQLGELLTAHPNISMVWFDSGGYPAELWETETLFRMIHQLRPEIIINNRCGVPGDFDTPEQKMGSFNLDRDWESCMTFTGFWSWHGFHTKVISYEECLEHLVRCAGGNGNLLMNIGPMPTGEIDPREADRMRRVGDWLKINSEAIYGTRGGPYLPALNFVSTRKGNSIFVHVLGWDGDTIKLPTLPGKVLQASLLTGVAVKFEQKADALEVTVPAELRQSGTTTVRLQLEVSAMDLAPIATP